MLPPPVIRSWIAAFLLMLAAIGFVPKSIFHDVVATHVDSTGCEHPKWEGPCLHQQGYHCHVNDLVVNSPYTFSVSAFSLTVPQLFAAHAETYHLLFLASRHQGAEGRGPPAIA